MGKSYPHGAASDYEYLFVWASNSMQPVYITFQTAVL